MVRPSFVGCFLSLSLVLFTSVQSLECPGKIKVFVKLSDPSQFGEQEEYLFQALTAYSIRDYCLSSSSCSSTVEATDDSNVIITDKTDRVSFCFSVDTTTDEVVRKSINGSLDRFYGGLQLTKEVLQIEGVDPILEEAADPDFPIWLIPFIVIAALVLLAALAMLYFSLKSSNDVPSDDEKEALTEEDDVEHGHVGPAASRVHEQHTQL